MNIHVKKENMLYQGVESKYLLQRLVYLVQYTTKYNGAKSEYEEIEHIINLLEQWDIIIYLQRREKALSDHLSELEVDSAAYAEAIVRHTELQDLMQDLQIAIDHKN